MSCEDKYTVKKINLRLIVPLLKKKLLVRKKEIIIKNLRLNWYLPISAVAFFCLNADLSIGYFVGLFISFIIIFIVSSQVSSIWSFLRKKHVVLQIISALTAAGICWGDQSIFYMSFNTSSKLQILKDLFPLSMVYLMSICGAVVSFLFVYTYIMIFWSGMIKIILEIRVFRDIRKQECMIYAILFLLVCFLVTAFFIQTEAFYGTEYDYDIIYTSDSPSLVKGNVYLSLTHPENDLRQPLFAVFAAPFVGMPYLIGRLTGAPESVRAILIDYSQLMILFVANYILTKIMKLGLRERICFMLFSICTYTDLLSSLMMEQYIIAYFWLIFCLYLICEEKKDHLIVSYGAAGTLMTSIVLLPFMSEKRPLRDLKGWISDMVAYGSGFLAMILVSCRSDVIFYIKKRVLFLNSFTGHDVSFADKVFQYTGFIHDCFIAPNAGVDSISVGHISWQLDPAKEISLVGVVILSLSLVSVILNKEKKSSRFAAGWIAFSVVLLLFIGWGSKENGMILYSLYFSWAFFVLLFQLVERIGYYLNVRCFLPVFSIGCSVVLLVTNIPAIKELLDFAVTYFPA